MLLELMINFFFQRKHQEEDDSNQGQPTHKKKPKKDKEKEKEVKTKMDAQKFIPTPYDVPYMPYIGQWETMQREEGFNPYRYGFMQVSLHKIKRKAEDY